jgi:hypothetical protein
MIFVGMQKIFGFDICCFSAFCLQMSSCDNLYCKYTFEHSSDWKFLQVHFLLVLSSWIEIALLFPFHCVNFNLSHVELCCLQGLDNGLSQIARTDGADHGFLFNYPIDVTFKAYIFYFTYYHCHFFFFRCINEFSHTLMFSSNAHGWPKLVISCYTLNFFGTDVVKGYGWVHLPTVPGRYVFEFVFSI